MVDKEKIRERMGGSGDSDSNKESGRRKPSKSGSKDKKNGSSSGRSKSTGSSNSSGVGVDNSVTSTTDVPRSHVKEVLMAIANSLLYAEGKSRAVDDPENGRERYSKAAADNIYEQYAEIASQYEVQLVAEKYGFDWENDIIKEVLEDQDYTGKVGV